MTPDELARDAAAAVASGASALHVHPRAGAKETLGPRQCGRAVAAIREAVPGTPVGVTTIATIEPDASRRVALVRSWTVLPDVASVNWSEEGSPALVSALIERGVGIEAGIWSVDDARRFVESDLARFCERALVEPTEPRTADALSTAEAIVEMLAPLGLPLVVHGQERTSWAVLRWAAAHAHGIRIGLEDTIALEGGRRAKDNAELVRAAAALVRR